MALKYYCYVDESGQDTQGDLFIVAVVIAAEERHELLRTLETIERETGKHRVKWNKTIYARRLAYIRRALESLQPRGRFCFALYRNTKAYLLLTVRTIVEALNVVSAAQHKAVVLIDALPPSQARAVGNALRRAGVKTEKVRGVRREESDAAIRLADALCGLVRAAHAGQPEMRSLLEFALSRGALVDMSDP